MILDSSIVDVDHSKSARRAAIPPIYPHISESEGMHWACFRALHASSMRHMLFAAYSGQHSTDRLEPDHRELQLELGTKIRVLKQQYTKSRMHSRH